jgi:hypothetical protein
MPLSPSYEPVERIALFISLSGKLDLASLPVALLAAREGLLGDLLVLLAFYYQHQTDLLLHSLQ